MSFLTTRKPVRDRSRRNVSRKTTQKLSQAIAMVDRLEDRVLLSYSPLGSTTNNGILTGDGTTGDTVSLQAIGGFIQWKSDSSTFTANWGGGVTVAANAGSTVTVNVAGSSQQLFIGNTTSPASALNDALVVINPDGAAGTGNTININDSASSTSTGEFSNPYIVDEGNSGDISGNAGINVLVAGPAASAGGITLEGSQGADTYDIMSTFNDGSVAEPFAIVGGSGHNNVFVGGDPANVAGLSGYPGFGTLSEISGPLTVSDPVGTTTLTLNDVTDTTSTSATITNNSVTGLSPAAINYVSGTATQGVTSLDILGGPGFFDPFFGFNGIDYTIQSTDAATPLTLQTGGEFDSVEISNADSVAGILGNIFIDNPVGFDSIDVNASADTTGTSATLAAVGTEATLTGLTGGTINYSSPSVDALSIENSTGTNKFTVNFGGTNATTNDNPIPPESISNGLSYNGGGGASSQLSLVGGTFATEVDNADGPGTGEIDWTSGGTPNVTTNLDYSGLTPVGDSTTVTTYTFNDNAFPDSSYDILNGVGVANSLIAGSTEFASSDSPDAFETTDVINKTHVQFVDTSFIASGGFVNVPTAAPGLVTLNITDAVPGPSDLNIRAFPPGVTSSFNLGGGFDTAEVFGPGLAAGTTIGDGGAPGNTNTLTYDANGNVVTEAFGPALYETKITDVTTGSVLDARRFKTVNIVNAPTAPITFGAVSALTGTEGTTLSNVTVGSFTVPGTTYTAANFLASINWGDGNFSGGTITQNPFNHAQFFIQGTHDYTKFGAYSPKLIVQFVGGTTTSTTTAGVTLNITTAAGVPQVQTDSATIADAPLLLTVNPIVASVGVATGPVAVGSFVDTGGAEPVADYTASVNYGDGSPTVILLGTTAGDIVSTGSNFVINDPAGHTYSKAGLFATVVTVTDIDPPPVVGSTSSVGGLAHVAAPTVTVGSVGVAGNNFSPVEGAPFVGPVGTITTSDTLAATTDFNAHISWGDGTFSTGVVSGPVGGPFTITGPHTYVEEGTYHVSITVSNDLGATATTIFETAIVSDPSVIATPGANIHVAAGTNTGVVTLATFTDPGGPESVANYSDTINWGDGTAPSSGVITYAGGTFTVKGSHIYTTAAVAPPYTITVTINHELSTPVMVTLNAFVTTAPLVGTGSATLKATTNTTFTNMVVAMFSDSNPFDTNPGNYSATINWGDKLPPNAPDITSGTIVYNPATKNFSVEGTHKYLLHGTYTVTTTVTEIGSTMPPTVITSKITV